MERKGRIHGYYYDGKTQWVMYEDEDGYIEMREMEDDDGCNEMASDERNG
jgi:hypothetical protein